MVGLAQSSASSQGVIFCALFIFLFHQASNEFALLYPALVDSTERVENFYAAAKGVTF